MLGGEAATRFYHMEANGYDDGLRNLMGLGERWCHQKGQWTENRSHLRDPSAIRGFWSPNTKGRQLENRSWGWEKGRLAIKTVQVHLLMFTIDKCRAWHLGKNGWRRVEENVLWGEIRTWSQGFGRNICMNIEMTRKQWNMVRRKKRETERGCCYLQGIWEHNPGCVNSHHEEGHR